MGDAFWRGSLSEVNMSQHTKPMMDLLRDLQRASWLSPPRPKVLVAAVEKIIALFDELQQLLRCVPGSLVTAWHSFVYCQSALFCRNFVLLAVVQLTVRKHCGFSISPV